MSKFREFARDKYKGILYAMPKKMAHKILYNRYHGGRHIDFENPQYYDEKIHWLIVNYYDTKYAKYADKVEVRDYVRKCGLEGILIPLVGKGVYNTTSEIDYKELPLKFVLKTNHGSGEDYYYICKDKSVIKIEEINEKFDVALKKDMGRLFCEYHYKGISPKLICESLLEDKENEFITDYKVVCSYGKAKAILICSDRFGGRDYFDPDWNYLPYVKEEYRYKKEIRKPELLSSMLEAAEKLSEIFPLARVDFYVVGNKLYFGEITLTPSSGYNYYLNEVGQREIGKMITLPTS